MAVMPNDHSSSPIITNKVKRPTRIVNWEILKKKFQTIPIWSFSWWGLQCLLCCQLSGKLLPYHFTLTLKLSGIFSVALSLKLPWPAINRHHFSLESGLSSPTYINIYKCDHSTFHKHLLSFNFKRSIIFSTI